MNQNPTDEISLSDYQALAEIRYYVHRFQHFSEQTARAAGLVPQQHQLLLALKGLPERRKATIRSISCQSLVSIISRYVSFAKGWFCRAASQAMRNLDP
jgi:hypothetical protein